MPQPYYEHHIMLGNDKLCPFKSHSSKDSRDTVCNWHRNIELLHITKGSGVVQYGAEELPVCKNDTVIVNSGALHRIYSESGLDYYCLIIDERFCLENGIDTSRLRFSPIARDVLLGNAVITAAEEIKQYEAAKEKSLTAAARMRYTVLMLLIMLCENYSNPEENMSEATSSSERYIKKVIEYLNDNLTEHITLEGLASVCGITKYHLAREFKRYTGQTIFSYLNVARCKRADACLAEGMTATEAALECGFESLSYFSRTYKKIKGYSPSERKNVK